MQRPTSLYTHTIDAYEGPYRWEAVGSLKAFRRVSDRHNDESVRLALLTWLHLLNESPLRPDYKPTRTVIHKLTKSLLSRPFRDTVIFYKGLGAQLAKACDNHRSSPKTGDFIPAFRGTPIFKEYLEWRKTQCPHLFAYIYEFCNFLKKAHYRDVRLESTALRGWKDVEERLPKHRFSSALTRNLAVIMRFLVGDLPRLSASAFLPRHGPGSVSEKKRNMYHKARLLGVPEKVKRSILAINQQAGYYRRETFLPFMDIGDTYTGITHARVKFVPKDMSKARTICMEPASFMFFQQAVMRHLYSHITRKLNRFIPLLDQSINWERARTGSLDNSIDTIDMSWASDSVHAGLVKAVVPPRLALYLFGTRTSQVLLPNGEFRTVFKFAPMGSATCFPTQCLLFLSVAILAMLYFQGHGTVTRSKIITLLSRRDDNDLVQPTVYGDDITCDSRVTRILVRLLTLLAFTVNEDKSFTSFDSFRESCGKFYWRGQDVTPTLYRVKDFNGRFSTSSYTSLLDLINRLGDKGYRSTRSFLIRVVRTRRFWHPRYVYKGQVSVPFTNDRNSQGIFTTRTTSVNNHLKTQVYGEVLTPEGNSISERFQMDFVKAIMVIPKKSCDRKTEIDFGYSYYMWQNEAEVRHVDFLRDRSKLSSDARLLPRWIRQE